MHLYKNRFLLHRFNYTCRTMCFIAYNKVEISIFANCFLCFCYSLNRLISREYHCHSLSACFYSLELSFNFCHIGRCRHSQFANYKTISIIFFLTLHFRHFGITTNTNGIDSLFSIIIPFTQSLSQKSNTWHKKKYSTFTFCFSLCYFQCCKSLTCSTSHYEFTALFCLKIFMRSVNSLLLMRTNCFFIC